MPTNLRSGLTLVLCGLALCTQLLGCGSGPAPKIFVIGLDGATWDLVSPWIDEGELPNLKALRDQSAWGQMNSVIPYLSPPAWTSAVTGVNPGRHGIFDFQRRIPNDDAVVSETSKSRRSPPIWNMLKGKGPQVGIVNVPMTDPPDEVDGFMIAGFPHLDDVGYTHPRDLMETIEADGYLKDKMGMKLPDGEEQAEYDLLLETQEERFETVMELYDPLAHDLFWVVFTGTDRMQHLFWQFDDPASPKYDPERAKMFGGSILKFWRRTDELLGELLAKIPEDTYVLVVSDHGFGPIHREIRIGNYLRDPANGFQKSEADDVFALDRSDAARLFIREPGRDPGGTRDAADRAALREKLIESLSAAIDPETDRKVLQAVYPNDRVFVGKFAERGPTLTLLPENEYYVALGDLEDGFQEESFGDVQSSLSGWHHLDGVFMLRGPAVRAGKVEQVYSLLDVVPTCLYVMRQAMAGDLEGDVMESCFDPDYLKKHEKRVEGFLGEEDRPLTPDEIEKLKNLPYIGG